MCDMTKVSSEWLYIAHWAASWQERERGRERERERETHIHTHTYTHTHTHVYTHTHTHTYFYVWHDSFMHDIPCQCFCCLLLLVRDVFYLYAWRDSLKCNMTHQCVKLLTNVYTRLGAHSCCCVAWLICTRDTTVIHDSLMRDIDDSLMRDIDDSFMRAINDSFVRDINDSFMRAIPCQCLRAPVFVAYSSWCVTWLICKHDMTHLYVTWLVTHHCVTQSCRTCVTWLINVMSHMCNMTHQCMT